MAPSPVASLRSLVPLLSAALMVTTLSVPPPVSAGDGSKNNPVSLSASGKPSGEASGVASGEASGPASGDDSGHESGQASGQGSAGAPDEADAATRAADDGSTSISGTAAADASPRRLRVGLALSGGGARGTAHIGVLEALEELHIPVDYIAGTSMGAAVGGLYASGMSTHDIRKLLGDIDWIDIFNDRSPRTDQSFRRKGDDELNLVDAKVGFGADGVKLPAGVIQGQKLDLLFSKYTLPVADIENFDELMIPYRAVAGDLVTGEPVVLSSGNLSQAMRASMSIPGFITPTEIDDRLLIDGGVAMNLPVEVVRAMGADVVIAVDISTPLRTRDQIDSVLAVTDQLTNFLTRRGTEEQIERMKPGDVLVVPDVGDIGTADFTRVADVIPIGYAAMMAKADALRPLTLPPETWTADRIERMARRPAGMKRPVIRFVRVKNDSDVADEVIEARLRGILLDQPMDPARVEKAISKVYGLELFGRVGYSIVTEDMQTGLEIDVTRRRWGPDYLQFGLAYNATNDDEARSALSISYLKTALNSRGAELRTTVQIGDEPGLVLDFYQPLARDAAYFVASKAGATSQLYGIYQDGDRVGEGRARGGYLDFGAGREIGAWGEARVGWRRGKGEWDVVAGAEDLISQSRFDTGNVFARFSVDNQDDRGFPRQGTRATLEWLMSRKELGADEEFDQLILGASHAFTRGRYTVQGGLDYRDTVDGTAPLESQFRLGGFASLSGFAGNELNGQQAAHAFLIGFRRIGDIALLPLYGGISGEFGNVWQADEDLDLADALAAGSLWLGADTPLGPIYAAYGRAEGGRSAFYLQVGRIF